MLITGLAGIVLIEIYSAVMQREFQNTENRIGKGFAILGIYLFVVCYCKSPPRRGCLNVRLLTPRSYLDGMLNSTTWLYGAEVLPIALRSKVMGLAAASHFIVNVAGRLHIHSERVLLLRQRPKTVTEAGPSAFAKIHENYYYVFVACSTFFLGVAYLYFPYVILRFVRRRRTNDINVS